MKNLLLIVLLLSPSLALAQTGAVASSSTPTSSDGAGGSGGAVTANLTLNDNVKIIWGTGGDFEGFFDGTNMLLDAIAGGVSFPGLGGTGSEVIGADAGLALESGGTNNTIFGDGAADLLTTGDDGVFMGRNAGNIFTTGGVNSVIIGADADGSGSGINGVTAVGRSAAGSSNSVAVGLNATATAATGGVAVGQVAIVNAIDGVTVGRASETADGVTVGALAGDASAGADVDNTLVGNDAGGALNGTSTDNSCFGDTACNDLTTGDQNTALGADTRLLDAGSDQIVLGFAAATSASNTMQIGSPSSHIIEIAVEAGAQTQGWTDYAETELITLNTGQTDTTSSGNLLRANSRIFIAVCQITTTITTAVNFDMGTAGDAVLFATNSTSITDGNDTFGSEFVGVAGEEWNSTATALVITTDANPGAGAMRCTVFGRAFSSATS